LSLKKLLKYFSFSTATIVPFVVLQRFPLSYYEVPASDVKSLITFFLVFMIASFYISFFIVKSNLVDPISRLVKSIKSGSDINPRESSNKIALVNDLYDMVQGMRSDTKKFLQKLEKTERDLLISKRKQRYLLKVHEVLEGIASKDPLTGVGNRHSLMEFLSKNIVDLAKEGLPLSLIMCDIDYFKQLNDLYGHYKGDDCIKKVAYTLLKCVREEDDLVVRYGGDEFMIVVPGAPKEILVKIANAIRNSMELEPMKNEGSLVSDAVTLSIGLAFFEDTSSLEPAEAIKTVDKALYRAKKNGRDCVSF
jgi:diguanylate cyclase (GGDEF)-like protein